VTGTGRRVLDGLAVRAEQGPASRLGRMKREVYPGRLREGDPSPPIRAK
jgi:hypothetical protein